MRRPVPLDISVLIYKKIHHIVFQRLFILWGLIIDDHIGAFLDVQPFKSPADSSLASGDHQDSIYPGFHLSRQYLS